MKISRSQLVRVLVFLVIAIVIAGVISEITFRMQGNTYSRDPQTIELVIPAGTSKQVAQGKSIIPKSQTFVVGDTLQVRNEDSVTQTLGPLVIPPGSSASMQLNQVGNLSYTCSFQPTQYYGITVQPAVTAWIRLQAALVAGIPLGLLLWVYSLVVKPGKPKDQNPRV